MFIELHLLQSFPPSCLNRDDTNSPKDCEFGGCRRARISSQCLKRAIRWHPQFLADMHGARGIRTRRVVEVLLGQPELRDLESPLLQRIVPAVAAALLGRLDETQRTRALVFLGSDELHRLAHLIRAHWPLLASATSQKAASRGGKDPLEAAARAVIKDFSPGTYAADVALFGRMVAENGAFHVNAACQVAHAISTHRLTAEMDFFTAVDDLRDSDSFGADHLGLTEFTSACFYRYALVDLEQLTLNLQGDRKLANALMKAFLWSSIVAVPTARQSSTAAAVPPGFILSVVREGAMPWSLVNAFEAPVTAGHGRTVLRGSVEALDRHWHRLARVYSESGVRARPACWLDDDIEAPHLSPARVGTVAELLHTVEQASAGEEEA